MALGDAFEEADIWLPWCYAVQGDTLLQLTKTDGQWVVSPQAETLYLRKDSLVQRVELTQ